MPDLDRSEVIEKLRGFVADECLKKPGFEIEKDEPLLSSGLLSSIHLVELAVFIEKTFGVYVPDTEFTTQDVDTLDAIADRVLKFSD